MDWFEQGQEFVKQQRYEEAMACFENAVRCGDGNGMVGIALCRELLANKPTEPPTGGSE